VQPIAGYARPVTEDTHWLTPEERRSWLALSRLLGTLPGALDAQLQRDAGLNYFEYVCLAMLSEQPERALPMSRLSTITAGSLSRLSNVVKRLEGRGYVRRCAEPSDRRVSVAVLTDEGYAALVAAAPAHVTHVRDLVLDALTADQLAALGEAASLVLDRVDPEGRTAVGD